MSDYSKYGDAAVKSAENYANKVLIEINKNVTDSGLRLLHLIEIIPNWETYLTPKQLEATKKYVKCLNSSEVDYELNLSTGVAYNRLFGNSKNKGALGKLEDVYKILDNQGYFERIKINSKKEEKRKNTIKKSVITDKTKEQLKELFTIISELNGYDQYLTNSQSEKLQKFLELKSIKRCAEYYGITEITFKQTLFGRSNSTGILGKLRNAYRETTVLKWEEI